MARDGIAHTGTNVLPHPTMLKSPDLFPQISVEPLEEESDDSLVPKDRSILHPETYGLRQVPETSPSPPEALPAHSSFFSEFKRPSFSGFIPDDIPETDPAFLKQDRNAPATISARYRKVDPETWVPEEFYRIASGFSVAEPESVVGESGRLYHGG
jgi:hypothetical protein